MKAGYGRHLAALILGFAVSGGACAAAVFDFTSTTRTLLSTTAPPPPLTNFVTVPGFDTPFFTVGNLFNGCGLWDGASTASRTETGTGCALGAHDTTSPVSNLAKEIVYTDTFTLAEDTLGVLQFMVKLGHPETPAWKNQNQLERFNVFLEGGGQKILLADFLDNVSNTTPGVEDDAYYLYVYGSALLPAGTWHPVFETRNGSIEFVAQLTGVTPVPEPGTLALLAAGLASLAGAARARRR